MNTKNQTQTETIAPDAAKDKALTGVRALRVATDKTPTITTARKTPRAKTLPKPRRLICNRPKRHALSRSSQIKTDDTPTLC